MDKLAFTSLAAVQSAGQIRAQITNAMANVSTVGFKDSYEVAAQAVKLDGDGYQSRFQPAVKARDMIRQCLAFRLPMETSRLRVGATYE